MSTSREYPAAHSMDTYWFAVDEVGQVAVFETGEEGHVPRGDANDILNELFRLVRRYDPTNEETWVPEDDRARSVGAYFFSYPDPYGMLAVLYERTVIPAPPLHIDQLPIELRDQCRELQFEKLRFDRCEVIQPVEHFPCIVYDSDLQLGYLASDGRTVRPIPGKEARFADWVRQFREQEPHDADGLLFDPPVD